MGSEMEKLKSKFILSIKENDVNKLRLENQNKSILSDVNDLKTLLKVSLQNERKLKKTILELNDVVNQQNKGIVKYKSELNGLSNKNRELSKQNKTDAVIKKICSKR